MKLKQLTSLILIALCFNLKAQIDTALIFAEIRALKTDSMIDDYWGKLKACDQNLHTFNNPVLQTENLLKAVYFFKYFGFSKHGYFNQQLEHQVNLFEDAQVIWIHQPFTAINCYTFPLISKCGRYKENEFSGYDPYFTQNLLLAHPGEKFDQLTYDKLKNNKFENIDINVLSSLAFESMKIYREITSQPIEQGIWKFHENSKLILYKTLEGKYILHALNYFKLTQMTATSFKFEDNLDGTYIEISDKGDLLVKDQNNSILATYQKQELKY